MRLRMTDISSYGIARFAPDGTVLWRFEGGGGPNAGHL